MEFTSELGLCRILLHVVDLETISIAQQKSCGYILWKSNEFVFGSNGGGYCSYAADFAAGGLYSDLPSSLNVVGKGSAFSKPFRGDSKGMVVEKVGTSGRCESKTRRLS